MEYQNRGIHRSDLDPESAFDGQLREYFNEPEQQAQLSETSLMRHRSRRFWITSILLALGITASMIMCTQSSAKSADEERNSAVHKELGSFNAFSEKALREIVKERGGNVFQGYISISKGVNIRTEPRIPAPGESPNTIRWDDVDSLNGFSLAGVESFIVRDPLIVESRNPSGSSRKLWLAFEAKEGMPFGGQKVVYVSWSEETADLVKRVNIDAADLNSTNQPHDIGVIIPKK